MIYWRSWSEISLTLQWNQIEGKGFSICEAGSFGLKISHSDNQFCDLEVWRGQANFSTSNISRKFKLNFFVPIFEETKVFIGLRWFLLFDTYFRNFILLGPTPWSSWYQKGLADIYTKLPFRRLWVESI